jgi:hypothetical protein
MKAVSGVFARVRSSSLVGSLSNNFGRLFVTPYTQEDRMAQAIIASPFGDFTSQSTIGLTQTHRFISAAVNPGSRPRPLAGRLSNGQSQCKSAVTIELDLVNPVAGWHGIDQRCLHWFHEVGQRITNPSARSIAALSGSMASA